MKIISDKKLYIRLSELISNKGKISLKHMNQFILF